MKAAILALVTTGALLVSTATADARPPRYHNNWGGVRYYPSYSASPYYRGYSGYRPYYSGYYPYNNGFSFNLGGLGIGIGNGYRYPYYGGYYSTPYYGSRYYYGGRWYYR
jgi:hypothetical protein